jgi:uncharacterized protein
MKDVDFSEHPLTKALFHLNLSKTYLEAFHIECKQQAKQNVNSWVRKVTSCLNDIYCSLTPNSREAYMNQLVKKDPLFLPQLTCLALQMNDDNRDKLEDYAIKLLKEQENGN